MLPPPLQYPPRNKLKGNQQKMKALSCFFVCAFVGLLPSMNAALTITPTFVDSSGETWTGDRQGVINQAISEWSSSFADTYHISIQFDFTSVPGGYLAQCQQSATISTGDNITPWYGGLTLSIHFNAAYFSGANYLWWDSTPTTSTDLPSAGWDALSVARHEIGHALGFSTFYASQKGTQYELSYWSRHITGTTFDPDGLNVALAAADNLSHLSASGATAGYLMTPAIANGQRREISSLELNMLDLALGYTAVPEPATALWSALGLGIIAIARRWRQRQP